MTANQLWTKYQKKRTNECRNDLVLHYLYLIKYHVDKAHRKNTHAHEDELFGAAYLGLIQAIEAYDFERKIKFETFCNRRIYGAMIDWLRELDLQSRTVRKFEKQKQKAEEILSHNGYYGETDVADKMGMSYKRFGMLDKLLIHGKEVLISSLRRNYSNHNLTVWDNWDTEDRREPDSTFSTNQCLLKESITKNLGYTERKIIILYYFEGLFMHEIAQIVNLCESRVSQIRSDAIARIREQTTVMNNLF